MVISRTLVLSIVNICPCGATEVTAVLIIHLDTTVLIICQIGRRCLVLVRRRGELHLFILILCLFHSCLRTVGRSRSARTEPTHVQGDHSKHHTTVLPQSKLELIKRLKSPRMDEALQHVGRSLLLWANTFFIVA